MLEFFTERLAALLIGLVLGLIIAIGLLVFADNIDQWWILVVVPVACGVVSALVGDKAVEVFKEIAKWAS
jgi:lysylphosphatidylglycerol synthetase-like protein (DUF2156 family)